MSRPAFAIALVALVGSCRPDLGDRDSLVTRPQILAVRGDPPEAKPGEPVRFSVLLAAPDGPSTDPPAGWAFCATPKLLTENGAASAACLAGGVRPIAEPSTAAIPTDACSLFGPVVSSAELRPRDPDVTGGFYQPVRVTTLEGAVAFGLQRITCPLANAAADITAELGRRYVANENPELEPLVATRAGSPVALDSIPRGETITFRARWPEGAAERYVVYDLASRRVVEHRETMRVSWFATGGSFANDRTGRAEDELESFTENAWTAPAEAGTVHLYVVLRDARGGVAFATQPLTVR